MSDSLLSVADATALLDRHRRDWSTEMLPLAACTGRVYAGPPLRADRPLPPYDRVSMDGIALRYADLGAQPLRIVGTQAAGVPALSLPPGPHCVEVMTGAVLPAAADTVIRYEDLDLADGCARVLPDAIVATGKNVHPRGTDCAAGTVLIEPKVRLGAGHLSIAASTGHYNLSVYRLPRTLIVTTGDELVPVDRTPRPHQIRRSNGVMLQSALASWGLPAATIHLPDDEAALRTALATALTDYDLLLCSGGVSKGKFDYLPGTLAALGVAQHFHRMAQRPGKPLWFGTHPGAVVFALPGNPVSSLVCAHRYVRPYLRTCLGLTQPPAYAVLAEPFTFAPALTYFLQVAVGTAPDGQRRAVPVAGKGSGDFANLRRATGVLELPADQRDFPAGSAYRYHPYAEPL